jgi:hypothetical protein
MNQSNAAMAMDWFAHGERAEAFNRREVRIVVSFHPRRGNQAIAFSLSTWWKHRQERFGFSKELANDSVSIPYYDWPANPTSVARFARAINITSKEQVTGDVSSAIFVPGQWTDIPAFRATLTRCSRTHFSVDLEPLNGDVGKRFLLIVAAAQLRLNELSVARSYCWTLFGVQLVSSFRIPSILSFWTQSIKRFFFGPAG